MPLTHRRPRPLSRDKQTFRDDRLFIIACDDTYAPAQYFGFFRIPRIHVHVVPTLDGTSHAQAVLTRLLEFKHADHDERWLVLDTDHCTQGQHVAAFMEALKRAGEQGIRVALSRPCFELWLLLHHAEEQGVAGLENAAAVEGKLREVLGEYNKSRLENRYSLVNVASACQRAHRLDGTVGGGADSRSKHQSGV
jgi:hypothetical protein